MNELEISMLKTGITTGASAAAAARAAALLLLRGETNKNITIVNPEGNLLEVPVESLELDGSCARAVVIKQGGDDPDVTSGLPVVAEVAVCAGGVHIMGGRGVGVVTRPGLQAPVGSPAINPVPRKMIVDALDDLIRPGSGVEVTISVPGGEEVALKTLNPRLGIVGGISILGTTGIVRPMSEEAFKKSLAPQVDLAVAAGYRKVVLTPGRIGFRTAVERYGLPREAVVEMSNFVGYMLDVCVDRGIEAVLLWGHHGKLVKVAAGIFHTHNRLADGRMETLAAFAGLYGAPAGLISKIMAAGSAEEALGLLKESGFAGIFNAIAARASTRAEAYTRTRLKAGTVLLGLDGTILGMDESTRLIGREMGWQKLL
ncbi:MULTISPECIES: cobalt-precorrin-5B (C(1))-methyltransferase CbiD [Pelotomaculum]|nr:MULTISPECIES: cobalt-precorrin-5B (C(1))-methyltransferase CbiD [Pelotomaculum]